MFIELAPIIDYHYFVACCSSLSLFKIQCRRIMSASFSAAIKRASRIPKEECFQTIINKAAPTTVSTLKNGLRVACETNSASKMATVGVWMETGSRYEDSYYAGTAQLLQKCGFIGTTNQSSQQIASAVSELGGQICGHVGREYSYVYMNVSKDHVNKAIGLLADVVRNARLSDADVVAARKLVLVDKKLEEEQHDNLVLDNLFHTAFGSTSNGLGVPLYGTETSLGKVGAEQLSEFRSKNIRGNRIVVVGSGDVDHTMLEKAAQSSFGDVEMGLVVPSLSETKFQGGEHRMYSQKGMTAAAWAFECAGATSSDIIPLALASVSKHAISSSPISSQMMDSIISGAFVSKKALKHATITVTPFLHTFKDSGVCGVLLSGLPKSSDASVGRMVADELQSSVAQWHDFSRRSMGESDLQQAKGALKRHLLFKMDGTANSALDIGKQVLQIGRRVPLNEMYERIDGVTSSTLRGVIDHYFIRRPLAFSYMGSIDAFPTYSSAQKWSNKYWH